MSDASGRLRYGTARLELLGWATVALVLVALAVPWFLWRDSSVVAGLPLWLWWHVAWMALAAAVFYVFTRRGWGVGVLSSDSGQGPTAESSNAPDAEEEGRRG